MENSSKKLLKQVFMVTFGLLLLLDIGRSVYARTAYAVPAEPWKSVPYENIAWPPGTGGEEESTFGKQVFLQHCAICHGSEGKGNGATAPSMIPAPLDLTLGFFKYKSTPVGHPPSDADLINTIMNGLKASAMPFFSDILTAEELFAVIDFIKSINPSFNGTTPVPIDIPPRIPPTEESIVRGKTLFLGYGCTLCHGMNGRGIAKLMDVNYKTVFARDLTAPWTFKGGSEPEQIWRRITTGLPPGPMAAYGSSMTEDQRWDVVNYILSISRVAPGEPGAILDGPGHQEDLLKRGDYLTHTEMCGVCHTQVNSDMVYSGDSYYLAGGMAIEAYPQGVFVSKNLNGDQATGLGNWSVEEIADAIQNGRSPEKMLNLWGMPWIFFHSFERDDALGIATYLKGLPPIRNKIPETLHYGFIETVIAKIIYSNNIPPVGDPARLVYKAGNYGQTEINVKSRGSLQQSLILAQWVVLGLGAGGFVYLKLREDWIPKTKLGRKLFSIKLLGLIILVFLGKTMYETPVLSFLPPAEINRGIESGIPLHDRESFDSPEQADLADRGRYLFTVASCAFCHGPDGAGGPKISMKSFGTIWVSNISSDIETGIGNWNDAQIARAIRSGISHDGRQLHWQGMLWDHFSNYDQEDILALVTYLRTLPPVEKEIPDPVPPSDADCEEYSFIFENTNNAGCK